MASHAEQYFNPPGIHPSLPNYLWLEAGTNFGVLDDNAPSSHHFSTTQHLVTLLQNKASFMEDLPGKYLRYHLSAHQQRALRSEAQSFGYFDDVTNTLNPNSAECINHVRPFTEFASDLANNNVATYNFITPNLCDDMHDSCKPTRNPVKQGDTWLSQNIPAILNSAAYKAGGAIFITWDEAATGDGPNRNDCALAVR